MRNKPRNVVGDDQMWAGMIPGLGAMNYFLGLLTVTVEIFLRRDFGERYFTRLNFMGGLMALVIWVLISKLFGLLSFFNPANWFGEPSKYASMPSWMPGIIRWYILFGIGHFLYMWWKDIIGKPVHSYSAGRSWLRPIGKAIMFLLNLVLNNLVRLVFLVNPKADRSRLTSILPVLRDVDTFTERFVEPFFMFLWGWWCFSVEQYAMAWWSIFSVMALNMYTGLRHEADRGVFLDYRDQAIELRNYREHVASDARRERSRSEKMVDDMAREVEKNPDVLPIIEAQNPSLARAIERVSSKLQAMSTQNGNHRDETAEA